MTLAPEGATEDAEGATCQSVTKGWHLRETEPAGCRQPAPQRGPAVRAAWARARRSEKPVVPRARVQSGDLALSRGSASSTARHQALPMAPRTRRLASRLSPSMTSPPHLRAHLRAASTRPIHPTCRTSPCAPSAVRQLLAVLASRCRHQQRPAAVPMLALVRLPVRGAAAYRRFSQRHLRYLINRSCPCLQWLNRGCGRPGHLARGRLLECRAGRTMVGHLRAEPNAEVVGQASSNRLKAGFAA